MTNGECAQCAELWRQYLQTSGVMKETETLLAIAGNERDHRKVKRLLAEVQSATQTRLEVSRRIEAHEHIGHPDGVDAAEVNVATRSDYRLSQVERAHIERIVAETGQNLSKAARILDIDRSTLYSKLRRYGLK